VALEPVYLADPKDTMDDVDKENGRGFLLPWRIWTWLPWITILPLTG
jgi:hypothetical protein